MTLFDLPPTQTAVSETFFQELHPLIGNDAPLEFHIASTNNLDYLDLSGSQLYVKLREVKADGAALVESDKVGPVNLFLHSLFFAVEITLQSKVIISNTN